MPNFGSDPTADAQYDALRQISQMMVGTKQLQDQPGVVYSLAQAKASPADAQTIDQFMQGLNAQKQVLIARAAGTYLKLDAGQQSMLDQLGVNYSDVLYTPKVEANLVDKRILDASGGKMTAKRNPDGSLALDEHGNVIEQSVEQHHADHGGFWGFLGDAWDKVKHVAMDDVIDPAVKGLTKAWNVVDYSLAGLPNPGDLGDHTPGHPSSSKSTIDEDMRALGYKPGSFFSTLAYEASGKAHSDLSDLEGAYGRDRVLEAVTFGANPKKIIDPILNDPNSYTTDADGVDSLTAEAKARLDYYDSEDFKALVRRVGAKTQTLGHDFANLLHIDPVDHPELYSLTAAGADIAASFAIDPTIMLGNVARGIKLSQVAIRGLGDSSGAARVLTQGGVYAGNVQRGWQKAIDLGADMRAAHAAGDDAKVAALTAQFQAELPGLAPIMDDFVGKNAVLHWEQGVDANGKTTLIPVRGDHGGITSLHSGDGQGGITATDWVQRKFNLQMLSHGRAGTQTGLMPGALSSVGYRKLKGAMASWMTTRSGERLSGAYDTAVSRLEADPMLAEKWLDDGLIRPMMPEANDAVAFSAEKDAPNVISYKPDSVSDALGKLIGAHREGLADAHISEALSSELDDLETKLQSAMADRTTDPSVLAGLHDDIQTGRSLLEMAQSGAKLSTKDISSAKAALKRAELELNDTAAVGGKDIANGADKFGAGSGPALPSQMRGAKYELTPAGKGEVQRNLRKTGKPTVEGGKIPGLGPAAIAERFRLAATRFSTLLPRNTVLDINDEATADKLYKFARTYLSRGEASQLRGAWNFANAGQRKVIIDGLIDQVGHAAGLGKTKTGLELLERAKAQEQVYAAGSDGIILNGEPIALSEGQTRQVWTLPSFQAWQQVADRIGLWEASMGRAVTSSNVDELMAQWKMGALFKPSTVTRNQLEGWLRVMIDGSLGKALKMRAYSTARNKELWARGVGAKPLEDYKDLETKLPSLTGAEAKAAKEQMEHLAGAPSVMHYMATQSGDTAKAESIANGTLLSGDQLGRSKGLATMLGELAPDTKRGTALAFAGVPFALAGRAYRSLMFRNMDEATLKALETINPNDLASFMEGYARQVLEGEGLLGARHAASEAAKIADAGWGPSLVKHATHRAKLRGQAAEEAETTTVKWKHTPLDDTKGVDAYSNHLHRMVDSQPQTAKAVLDYIERAKVRTDAGDGDVTEIVRALDDEAKNTAYGRVYFDDPVNAPGVARDAVNEKEIAAGKEEWARQLVKEYEYLLTGRNGVYQHSIAQHIRDKGEAPDGHWIVENVKGDHRPETTLAPEVMAMPSGGIRGLAQSFLDLEGGAYQWFVERPLQRTTSSPVFLVHYAEARKALNADVERMVRDLGVSPSAAETFAQESAVRQAWIKTEQLIDDPGQKTQFDVVARNLFPFARATNAMIRRWGTGLWQNPVAARKMMLAYEGAQHSGFIYNNQYGEPTFVYPTSGAFNMALRGMSELPWMGNLAQFPLSADMTGGVLMSVPGADNPFKFSAGPMVTMPLRIVYENFLPTSLQGDAKALDEKINGPVGVGETWQQLLPTAARKFYDNVLADDRNSAFASASNGALANLAAAGLVPPPDASPSVIKAFQGRYQTQVRNQLYLRFALGLFAPAPPSKPGELTDASRSDFAWSLQGVKGLSDEYKAILNDVEGDVAHANAIFTAMHPDELVYNDDGSVGVFKPTASAFETPASATTTKGAQLVNTKASLKWMDDNAPWIEKYKTVSAYFMPKASLGDPFSQGAYDMQLELGLRQRKTPQEFMADVYTRAAERPYYAQLDSFDARIAAAKAEGDADAVKNLTAQRAQFNDAYKAKNPFLKDKLDGYSDDRRDANWQLADLRQMIADKDVPQGQQKLLSDLVANYDGYVAYIHTPGKTQPQKSAALGLFNNWAQQNVAGTPLEDLFNGVFRTLNPNIEAVQAKPGPA